MEIKKELNVIRRDNGLGTLKPAYIVEYEGKEQRVSMFNFQKERPVPEKIRCVIEGNYLYQDYRTLLDEFYEIGKSYLFKIKERRATLKYYELEDERLKGDTLALNLPFPEPSSNLEVGRIIECKVTGFADKKPYLCLTNANPSLIDFLDKETVFGTDESLQAWLKRVFTEDYLKETARLYEMEDGGWIYQAAKEMEKIIYSLLLSKLDNKERLLASLCNGWLDTIEHSPFMAKLSGKEKDDYSPWLAHSIEVCEDFKDALSLPDKEEKVAEIISTLNPGYYQYRLERKLRFLACIFSLSPEILGKNIDALLEQIGHIGEKESSEDGKYISIRALLLMSLHLATDKWTDRLSIPHEAIKEIKCGILSLCYLIKAMIRRNEHDAVVYASRLYLLISLCINENKEKSRILRNAYTSLFSDLRTAFQFKWEDLSTIVRSRLYLFSRDIVRVNTKKGLAFDKLSSCCKLSVNEIQLAPGNYQEAGEVFKLADTLNTRICYDKSLSRLDVEEDFLSVRNAWKEVDNIFKSPRKKVEKRTAMLLDGDDVNIYITRITEDKTFAYCKAVGYEEEGIILFKDLFFYKSPNLDIDDFMGSDGTPLIFPAQCQIDKEGNITFAAESYKIDYAKGALSEGEEVECSVLKRNPNGLYVCLTSRGFFLYLDADGEELVPGALVNATITQMLKRGNAQARLEEVIQENGAFYGKEAYVNYLREFNRWCYDEEMTLKKMDDEDDASADPEKSPTSQRATPEEIRNVADIVSKLSETEKNPRRRYGYLAVSRMLAYIVGDERYEEVLDLRMKFVEILYNFSLNNRLQQSDMADFKNTMKERPLASSEAEEMHDILSILYKFGKRTNNQELDKTLIYYLESSSPTEKELARLILSGNLLFNFQNPELQDKVLDEIGKVINIDIIKPKHVHIGEEMHRQEFKTSLVFPPNNGGNEDLEQQSENILREILAMMNAKGGVLYIGVNDDGNVVGLYDDLHYFADSATAYNETKAKDNFENHFSCLLTERLGAENASKFDYGFENKEGYVIFRVEIPVLHVDENNLYRVGNTVQEART